MFEKWWSQAKHIDLLQREVKFANDQKAEIEGLLNREETRNALLETALKEEQKAHNMALRRYADQMSKQVGLGQHFVADATPKPESKPLILSAHEEEEVRWAAKAQQDSDIEKGYDPQPIEFYENAIREDRDKFILD